MSELETTVERLKAEATDRWGERWTISVNRYADGDFNAYALRSRGRNENGHLVEDRIYITENDEILVSQRTFDRQEIDSELLEPPSSST